MKVTFPKPGDKIKTREKRQQLKEIPIGALFRYATTPSSVAKKTPGQSFFWRVADIGPAKANRVTVMTCDKKQTFERDDDHLVIVHAHELQISPAATEPVPDREDESDTK